MGMGFLYGVMKCSKIDCADGHKTLNILKITNLPTINGWTVWHVNYIFKKKPHPHGKSDKERKIEKTDQGRGGGKGGLGRDEKVGAATSGG